MPAALALVLLLVLQAPPSLVQSVDLAVPFQPVSFRQGDRDQIAYELHITNFQRTDILLMGVRVNSNRGPLIEYRGGELHRRITRPGLPNDHPDPSVLAPGMRAVIHFWIPLRDAAIVPSSISHVVELTVTRPDGAEMVTVSGGAVVVNTAPAIVIDPP